MRVRSVLLLALGGLALTTCAGGPNAQPVAPVTAEPVAFPAEPPVQPLAPVAPPPTSPAPPGPGLSPGAPPAPPAETTRDVATQPARKRVKAPVGEPALIRVPAIGVARPLVSVGLNPDRSLEVPDDESIAGWYRNAPRPGGLGPAIIAGHNNWNGRSGIFLRLRELAPGDVVEVDYDDGSTVRFVVDRLEQHAKDAFPTAAVYGNTTAPELRVITCGGVFDPVRGEHVDNIIVFASLAP